MNNLVLNTHLNLDDYIRVNMYLLYRKFIIQFMTGVGLLILMWLLIDLTTLPGFPWLQLILALYLIAGFPLTTYFSAKRNYKSTPRIRERISYEFNEDGIILIAESFEAKLSWSTIYAVSESQNWILIWQNPHLADVIPKRDFTPGTLKAFKDIVMKHSNIKNKMKHAHL